MHVCLTIDDQWPGGGDLHAGKEEGCEEVSEEVLEEEVRSLSSERVSLANTGTFRDPADPL
jgi:hypothetical protein